MTYRDVELQNADVESNRSLMSDEVEYTPEKPSRQTTRGSCFWSPIPWMVTTALLITFNVFFALSYHVNDETTVGSYEKGFSTDLKMTQKAIGFEQVTFSGALRYRNNTLYPIEDPTQPKYAGVPNEEIDKNWEKLLGGRYFRLNEKQSEHFGNLTEVPPIPAQNITGGLYGGVDMLHSLHCLNALRQMMDPVYYKDHNAVLPKELMRMHIDHCVEQLRQAIMCHGDLTPVTLQPIVMHGRMWLLGQTEQTHTCRNGAMIREWTTKMGQERGAI